MLKKEIILKIAISVIKVIVWVLKIQKVEAEKKSNTVKKRKKSYSLEYKKEIVKEYLENKNTSIREIANKNDIPKSSISEWSNSYDIIKKK